jgi:DNA helicase-2/ATP-dependent DNA helicase PcrA
MDRDLLAQLNKNQLAAVTHTDGPSVILAGAGSGKTRVLTYKVLYLIEEKKIDASRIAMMTFTNKAAQEMKLRVKKDLGFTGTFHSLGAKLLRHQAHYAGLDFNFVIYDEDDSEGLIKQIMKENPPQVLRKITSKSVKYRISGAKDNLLTPAQLKTFADDEYSLYMAQLYAEYQRRLEKNNAVDFDDLIFKIVKMCEDHEHVRKKYADMFDYVLVDEFQDTNAGQYAMAKYLAGEKKNITVVGDFAQSIYSWRGADIKNLSRFEEDFDDVQVFHLEQNYRSTQNVLNFAYDIIVENGSHPVLKLFTDNAEGDDVTILQLMNEEQEAVFIAEEIKKHLHTYEYDDFAVLYRMNAQSRVIEEVFLHYGIPYVLIGGTRFYERKEIKDILAYVRASQAS